MKPLNSYSLPGRINLYVRSLLFLGVMVVMTVLLGPFVLLRRNASFEANYPVLKLWVRAVLGALDKICGLRYEVQGAENIPADRNGVILSKHQSAWETFAFLECFPPLVFLLKQELLRIPVWGWALARCEPIAIDRSARSAALKELLRQGQDRLSKGRWVVLFPEGTRVAPGHKGKYAGSGGMLAQRAGCPVVPVAHNSGRFWLRKSIVKLPGVIQVRIGPPIDAGQYSAQEIVALAENWIESQMAEIDIG
ncbi:MAG TPA: lysophospholipid acyltransferase family protein [Methylococcaceae bacterium]|nr:lysophospholipid acyltransferase family protein [Methylococcaceae bacterium]